MILITMTSRVVFKCVCVSVCADVLIRGQAALLPLAPTGEDLRRMLAPPFFSVVVEDPPRGCRGDGEQATNSSQARRQHSPLVTALGSACE